MSLPIFSPNSGHCLAGSSSGNYPGTQHPHGPLPIRSVVHLIREMDTFMLSENGEKLSEEIHLMFTDIRESLKSHDMDQRKSIKIEVRSRDGRTHSQIRYLSGTPQICGVYPQQSRFMVHPLARQRLEPTNNLALQAIQEHVVIRKIIGTFQSKQGSQNYRYISSLIATWRLKGVSMFMEMDRILRKELCDYG